MTQLRGQRDMDLNFCDICNESVPLSDLDAGRAKRRPNGRVVCAACEASMSHEVGADGASRVEEGPAGSVPAASAPGSPPPANPVGAGAPAVGAPAAGVAYAPAPAPTRAGASTGAVFLVGLMAAAALVVASVVTVVLVERIQRVRTEVDSSARRGDRAVERKIDELEGTLAAWRDEERQLRADELEGLRADGISARSRTDAKLEVVTARLEGVDELVQRLAAIDARVESGRESSSRLQAEVAQLQRDVGVLAERWMEALATGDVVEEAAVAEEAPPEWIEDTRGLDSPSAATRWSAVTALGDTGDLEVVPYLLPMLADPDIFVRMATARILGEDLPSIQSVPALIDALDDTEPAVREAVVAALRDVTGENYRFDPMANESDRQRKVKAWRDWWKKEGQALAAQG